MSSHGQSPTAETLSIDAFVEARLADWEKAANAAAPGWAVDVLDSSEINGAIGGYAADLLMLFDPEAVLRLCAALRQILEAADWIGHDAGDPGASAAYARPFLKSAASIWSSHPDFRAEWTA